MALIVDTVAAKQADGVLHPAHKAVTGITEKRTIIGGCVFVFFLQARDCAFGYIRK